MHYRVHLAINPFVLAYCPQFVCVLFHIDIINLLVPAWPISITGNSVAIEVLIIELYYEMCLFIAELSAESRW